MKRWKQAQIGVVTGCLLTAAACLGLCSSEALGLSGFFDTGVLEMLPADGLSLYRHPYIDNKGNVDGERSLQLHSRGALSFDGAVRGFAQGAELNPFLQMRRVNSNGGTALGLTGNDSRSQYQFFVSGVRVCGYDAVAHRLRDGSVAMMGEAPKFADGNVPSLIDWPSQDDAFHRVSEAIGDGFQVAAASAVQKSAERCLLVVEESLKPAWEITIQIDQLMYRGWADHHQSYGAEPRFFSATGTASVYVENPRTGSIKDVSLTGLDDGTQELKSAYFETYPVGKTKASSASRTYSYTTSQIQFDETSAFTHGSRQMDLFNSLQKELTGKAYDFAGERILIVVHAQPGGTPNNALYQPKSSSSYGQPTIMIGDGDGSILQNLSWDSDVVSHELGHHIVFEFLKSISGQSLTLHEALADFFAFSRSGDACLGESICPDGSPSYVNRGACWKAKECLRSGETTLKATDKVIPDTSISIKDGHIRGQVVSGNLWDLRKSGKIPAADLTKLVFKAVTYLRDSSGFRDLQLALFLADQELFAKKYASALYDAAIARGFEAYITDVKVTSGSTYPEVGSPGPSDSLSSSSSSSSGDDSSKKKILGICGVGTGVPGLMGGWLTLLPLLLLPILVHIRRPVRAPVRNSRSDAKQRPQPKA